eukprot:2962013-Heterocapsa_arctica.AAC.1
MVLFKVAPPYSMSPALNGTIVSVTCGAPCLVASGVFVPLRCTPHRSWGGQLGSMPSLPRTVSLKAGSVLSGSANA